MKIIISPAKRMKEDNDFILPKGLPVFIKKAEVLKEYISKLSYEELKKLLECNDEIAGLNYERYKKMELQGASTPAILAYEGIQYKYMAPDVFEYEYFEYVQEKLRILSGFYGVLKPFDAVVPYRIEMQARFKTNFCDNLYDFWKDDIFLELIKNEKTILNLASKEYSKVIKKYLTKEIMFVTCVFGQVIDGKIKEKGVYVKMARGEMVRFMAENKVENIEEIKGFDRLGFRFSKEFSKDDSFVFIR